MMNTTAVSKEDGFSESRDLAQEVRHVVPLPGVYLMRDDKGTILYVGKARNLKKRLQSYFQSNRPHDPKTALLLTRVKAFETISTHTEKEAFILESNLIKRHRPRFNVNLKDDKRYPSLRLNPSDLYPNLTIVRKIADDGALYFGPYTSAGAVRQTIKFINKTFKLCKCRCDRFKKRTRPCLNFQMGLCMGPCFSHVDPKAYREVVGEVVAFLKGRTPALIRKIERQMKTAARNQVFEQAASLRDKMFALRQTLEKQVMVTADLKDRDVVAIVIEKDLSVITLLRVRGGFLLGSRHFIFENTIGSEQEQMDAFLRQYYHRSPSPPREVVVSHMPVEQGLVEELLYEQKGARVTLLAPQRGDREKLVRMAIQNAGQALQEHRRQADSRSDILARLQKKLHLKRLPERIECFDNSNLGGTQPVSAMVVFEHGVVQPSACRRYKLQVSDRPDDYAYMAEVLQRRFGKQDAQPYPDLLLVDGGKGQLSVALAVLTDCELDRAFDTAAIAKKNLYAGEHQDKVFLPGRSNPVQFGRDEDLLLFLQRIRDEAHRWAVGFQRRRREGQALVSALDRIQGIGPKRKAQLLQHFGSPALIASASIEEIQSLPGIHATLARTIKEALRTSNEDQH
jgi:excinuclease ABC subunit C